jgi:hypothetical protein
MRKRHDQSENQDREGSTQDRCIEKSREYGRGKRQDDVGVCTREQKRDGKPENELLGKRWDNCGTRRGDRTNVRHEFLLVK